MNAKYFLLGAELPLEAYRLVEVLEVAADRETGEIFDSSSDGFKEKIDDAVYFWSVYLRQTPDEAGFNSAECIADVPNRKAAEFLAAGLEAAIAAISEEGAE